MSEAIKFTEDILSAARAKAQAIMSAAEAETRKALEEARNHATHEADDIIRDAQSEAEGIKRRHMSEVRHRLKLKEQEEKSKILSQVLDEVRSKISDLTKQESKYLPILTTLVEKGVSELGLEEVTIHLNAADAKRVDRGRLQQEVAKKVGRQLKLEWAKEPIETSGGAVISSPDGRIRIVNTLDERMRSLEPKLLTEAGRLLFEER